MLRKFAAASLVGSCVISLGGLALIAIRLLANQRYYQIAVLWCLVPVVWGAWAVLTPKSWFPARLPLWGAILGVFAYLMGVWVIDVPGRVAGWSLPLGWKLAGAVIAPCIYYLVWMLVGPVYHALTPHDETAAHHARAA